MIGISVLIYNWEASLPLLPYEDTVTKGPSMNQEKGCHQTIDLELPSLQNYEKQVSVNRPRSLWYFCYTIQGSFEGEMKGRSGRGWGRSHGDTLFPPLSQGARYKFKNEMWVLIRYQRMSGLQIQVKKKDLFFSISIQEKSAEI